MFPDSRFQKMPTLQGIPNIFNNFMNIYCFCSQTSYCFSFFRLREASSS
jgi:hypothetical protein